MHGSRLICTLWHSKPQMLGCDCLGMKPSSAHQVSWLSGGRSRRLNLNRIMAASES